MYILKKEDYEQIEQLKNITSSIDLLYKELYDLENHGKKDSDNYKKLIERLKTTIDTEDSIYSKISLTYDKIAAFTNYLLSDIKFIYLDGDIETIIKQKNDYRVKRRIMNNLIYYGFLTKIKDCLLEDPDDIDLIDQNKLNKIYVRNELILHNYVEQDIIKVFLSFIEESISNKNNSYLKSDLINSKYNIAFIDKDIESDMLANSFTVSNSIYTKSKMAMDFTNTEQYIYESIKDECAYNYAYNEISGLLELHDNDHDNYSNKSIIILRLLLLKSSLLFMSDDAIDNLKDQTDYLLNDKYYLETYYYDTRSKDLITDCFNTYKKGQDKIKTLSLL